MGNLGPVTVQGHQAASGERGQDRVDLRRGSGRQPGVKLLPADRAAGQPAIGSHRHVREQLPGEHLLTGGEGVVDVIGSGLDCVADPASLAVAVAGQPVSLPVFPGERQCLGEQGKRSGRIVATQGAQIAEDGAGQRRIDAEPGRCGRAGDRRPELGLGHLPDDELPVLQRGRDPGKRGALIPEVGTDRDHHQGGRFVPRASPAGSGRAQRGHECPPRILPRRAGVQREYLLELVDDEQQPGAVTGGRALLTPAGGSRAHRLPDGLVCLFRVPCEPVPDRQDVVAAQCRQPGGQFGQRVRGGCHGYPGPLAGSRYLPAASQDGEQAGLQQRGLSRTRHPGDDDRAALGHPGGQFGGQFGGEPLPSVEQPRVGLLEGQQSPVGAAQHPGASLAAAFYGGLASAGLAWPGRQLLAHEADVG